MVCFNECRIRPNAKVLVLAPHPDDFDAIAVTLKLFKENGNHIELAVVSGAASGVEQRFCLKHPGLTKEEIREKEQLASCSFFGLDSKHVSFLRLDEDENGDPELSDDNISILQEYLQKIQPEIIFMPHWNDSNPGHQRTYKMYKKTHWKATVYLNYDPKTLKMRNDLYTFFDEEEAEWKSKMLRLHKSQHERNLRTRGYGFDERVLQINRLIAMENACGVPYAEVFEVTSM